MRREDEDAEAAVVDADEERKPNSEQDRELAKVYCNLTLEPRSRMENSYLRVSSKS